MSAEITKLIKYNQQANQLGWVVPQQAFITHDLLGLILIFFAIQLQKVTLGFLVRKLSKGKLKICYWF